VHQLVNKKNFDRVIMSKVGLAAKVRHLGEGIRVVTRLCVL